MDNNLQQTEFNGNISCLMRHHKHIETFYSARSENFIAGMYTELLNIVGDIIPEMSDAEYAEWNEIKSILKSNYLTYKNTRKSVMVDKHMKNVVSTNFTTLICDNFEKYMRLSKSKGMLQRNNKTMRDTLL
jgi:hypothetical protein